MLKREVAIPLPFGRIRINHGERGAKEFLRTDGLPRVAQRFSEPQSRTDRSRSVPGLLGFSNQLGLKRNCLLGLPGDPLKLAQHHSGAERLTRRTTSYRCFDFEAVGIDFGGSKRNLAQALIPAGKRLQSSQGNCLERGYRSTFPSRSTFSNST